MFMGKNTRERSGLDSAMLDIEVIRLILGSRVPGLGSGYFGTAGSGPGPYPA